MSRNTLIRRLLAWLAALGVIVVVVSYGPGGPPPGPTPRPTASERATDRPTPASGGPTARATPSAAPTATATPTAAATATAAPSGAHPWGPFPTTGIQGRVEPDPLLTPGALNPDVTQATIGSTICVPGWTATIRPPPSITAPLKVRQIAAYGYTDTNPSSYELDHLVPLELGGAPGDPLNLWPEPHAAVLVDGTDVGASVKDTFENWSKRAVCAGTETLAVAQDGIRRDWVSAWIAAGKP